MGLAKNEAPRTLISFIWATAAMLTIFFAVIISSFFVLKHYYPVSASDATVLPETLGCDKAKNQSQIAINNYPGETAITAEYAKTNPDYQHGPVEEALGGDYQCSTICVPGIDQSKPVSDPANISVIKNYLVGATIGGKPILADVPNGTSFIGTVKLAIAQTDPKLKQEQLDQLKRIVIVPYSKNICAGNIGGKGQSVPYEEIETKDKQKVKEIVPNDTKAKADLAAQQKAASEKANAVAPVPIAGVPKTGFDVATTGDSDTVLTWKCMKVEASGTKYDWFYKTKLDDRETPELGSVGWQQRNGNVFIDETLTELIIESKESSKDCGVTPTDNPKAASTNKATTEIDYKSKLNDCKVEITAINAKYVRLRNASNNDLQTKLNNLWINFKKTVLNSTFTNNQSGYEKCKSVLADYHSLLEEEKAKESGTAQGSPDTKTPAASSDTTKTRIAEKLKTLGGAGTIIDANYNITEYLRQMREYADSWQSDPKALAYLKTTKAYPRMMSDLDRLSKADRPKSLNKLKLMLAEAELLKDDIVQMDKHLYGDDTISPNIPGALDPVRSETLASVAATSAVTTKIYKKIKLQGIVYWKENGDNHSYKTRVCVFARGIKHCLNDSFDEYVITGGRFNLNINVSGIPEHLLKRLYVYSETSAGVHYAANALTILDFDLSGYSNGEYWSNGLLNLGILRADTWTDNYVNFTDYSGGLVTKGGHFVW